jgi:hypothetical protein
LGRTRIQTGGGFIYMTDDFPYPKLYSNCCGERAMNIDELNFGKDGDVTGRCPKCKDGCEFMTEEEMENDNEK